ncbi:MAG TPA: OsmC family protein [Gaiellaceae bacterium]|nr:OsmC family protein [Gaiellaceae bacterium]
MPIRARSFSYAVSVGRDGAATSEQGGSPIPADEAWSPEHLVLAGLARCTLTSLRFHAERDGIEVAGGADAAGEVAVRDTDGRYAFIRIKVEVDVTLDPKPAFVRELVAKAERDCFVGASLTAKPRYRWTVNGEALA